MTIRSPMRGNDFWYEKIGRILSRMGNYGIEGFSEEVGSPTGVVMDFLYGKMTEEQLKCWIMKWSTGEGK